ncbi:MAG: hypothetical protein F6K58_11115 [Symploca sp. SIO2E9]|nr:hypothetical protein [Symploca sp. SIO2E9]
MQGQMCWLSRLGTDGEKILHLRTTSYKPWQPYTAFHQYAIPDYRIPGGSKGYATYQKLLTEGWVLVPSQGEIGSEDENLAS